MLQASASAVILDTGRKAAPSTQRPANATMIRSTAVKQEVAMSVTLCVRYMGDISTPVTMVPMRVGLTPALPGEKSPIAYRRTS